MLYAKDSTATLEQRVKEVVPVQMVLVHTLAHFFLPLLFIHCPEQGPAFARFQFTYRYSSMLADTNLSCWMFCESYRLFFTDYRH